MFTRKCRRITVNPIFASGPDCSVASFLSVWKTISVLSADIKAGDESLGSHYLDLTTNPWCLNKLMHAEGASSYFSKYKEGTVCAIGADDFFSFVTHRFLWNSKPKTEYLIKSFFYLTA